ncbi:uncharacterized protein N7484_007106 [Penicillium longicatenatum]|uniref:uncharacterized protein n=1 Tax=Penicillium longicatenatum TaxID=1561947 RepID=UPI0025477992|nr:uncharacterized protein N7484_007106 [Penicillium longicatenatum]KAJ5639244.1 hypothetical protein N7484_007106 [Penicillium longicatenatum]
MVSMPHGLISAPRLKPAIRLAQAVSEYEADLTRDQKEAFNRCRSRACEKAPSIQDVMQLTADIDEQLSTKIRGRCLGTRTTSFLQSVQQFVSLGDIIVGGTQNLVASGVWALLVLNFSTYFEKISNIFMIIGRSAPRYEKLALLYPRSKELQSLLLDYFTVVVRLCHCILKFTRKSTLGKIGATLDDSDLKTFLTQLETRAKDIKDEVNYLMAQRIEEQASFTTQLWSRKYSKEITHQRQMKAYLAALEFCSTYDYMAPWKQARRLGNTTLFYQCPQYIDWRERASSCSLVLTGRLGSGKSVLLANIVDDLNLNTQGQNTTVAFFFSRHDLPDSLKPRNIIGSIARQLLWSIPGMADKVSNFDFKGEPDEFNTIRRLIETCVPPDLKAYLVIDGLDEFETADRQVVIQELRWLQQRISLLLCASVRKEPRDLYGIDLAWERLESAEIAAIPDNASDIEVFIETELELCIRSGKLTIGNPLLILEIQDALLKGSQGMFLWVALQIDNLCTMCTDEAIRQALVDLPRTLSETFDRILRRFDSNVARTHQRSILQIIVAARHPLKPGELREALSVEPGDPTWNPSKLVNDIFGILTCCGGLLTIDEEENTVRLVHSSVRQYLIGSEDMDSELMNTKFTLEEAERKMADIAITYLNYGVFETQISTRVNKTLQVDSAPAKIVESVFEVPNVVRDLAMSLLKLRKTPGFDLGKTLEQLRPRHESISVQKFCFLSYAKSNCLHHAVSTLRHLKQAMSPEIENLLLRLLGGTMLDINTSDGHTLLLLAAEKGIESILMVLLQSGKIDPNSADQSGQTPLFLAAASGHEAIVTYILGISTVDTNLSSKNRQNALHVAIQRKHNSVAEILIKSTRTNLNAKDNFGRAPLHMALESLDTDPIAGLLLKSSSTLLDEQEDLHGLTPLHKAVIIGNNAIAKRLLSSGKVKTNTKNRDGQTAFHLAAKHDRTGEITQVLLQLNHTDADQEDEQMITPIHQTVKSRNTATLKVLIDSGQIDPPFKVNGRIRNLNEWTVMHAVAQYGDEEMTKLLLSYDQVDANARDFDRKTPLHYACSSGNAPFVRCMLESDKVLVNAKDDIGRTPLHVAFMHDSPGVADLLLKSERVNSLEKDLDGLTAFDYSDLLWNLTVGTVQGVQ